MPMPRSAALRIHPLMAQKRQARRERQEQQAQESKEIIAPHKVEKKSVSTKALFVANADRVRKRRAEGQASARQASKKTPLGPATKPSPGRGRSSHLKPVSASAAKKVLHPFAEQFSSSTAEYREHVTDSAYSNLDQAHEKLLRRLDTKAHDDNTDAHPSEATALSAALARALQLSSATSTPLSDQTVRVKFKDCAGVHDIPVGLTVEKFKLTLRAKKAELERLWHEWDGVCSAIASLGAEVLEDPTFPVRFGFGAVEVAPRGTMGSVAEREIERLRGEVCELRERGEGMLREEIRNDAGQREETTRSWHDFLKTA